MESSGGAEQAGLCPHGMLPGLCAKCLETEEGREVRAGISQRAGEEATARADERVKQGNIGSKIARELERITGIVPYDIVMVLGAGFKERRNHHQFNNQDEPIDPDHYRPGWMLSKESKLRLCAAAQLYFEGRARVICLTGGPAHSEKWQDYGTLADLGKRYLVQKFHIPEDDIIMENVSDATHGNLAHGLRQLYQNNVPTGSMVVISSAYHLERATKMAEMSGIKVDTLPAEELLLQRSPHYQRFLDNWARRVEEAHLVEAETAKLADEEYWNDREKIFTTPLDQAVPDLDISQSIALAQKAIVEAGGEIGESAF